MLAPTGKGAFFFSLFCRGGPRVVPVVKGSRLSVPFSSLRSCLCLVGTPRSCSQETASHSPPASWSHRGGGPARRRPPGARTDRSGWLVYCRSPRWWSALRSLVSPGSRDLHFHFLFFRFGETSAICHGYSHSLGFSFAFFLLPLLKLASVFFFRVVTANTHTHHRDEVSFWSSQYRASQKTERQCLTMEHQLWSLAIEMDKTMMLWRTVLRSGLVMLVNTAPAK